MNYNYEYYMDTPVMDDEIAALFAGIYGILVLATLAVNLACYVMRALSLYTIASRRGLRNPWLSWLPVGDAWILGSVSDQYRYIVKGERKSRRKILLGLSIGGMACVAAAIVMGAAMIFSVVAAEMEGPVSDSAMASMVMGPALSGMAIAMIALVVGVLTLVFRYMSLYDLYRSCDPGNATAYLCVGIVGSLAGSLIPFSVLLEPIFLMVVRRKDKGMPPRKPPQSVPVYENPGPEIE